MMAFKNPAVENRISLNILIKLSGIGQHGIALYLSIVPVPLPYINLIKLLANPAHCFATLLLDHVGTGKDKVE